MIENSTSAQMTASVRLDELFLSIHITQHAVVLRVAFSPGPSGVGCNGCVSSLSVAMAGNALAAQGLDVQCLRRIDCRQLRQHVLDCAQAYSRTVL